MQNWKIITYNSDNSIFLFSLLSSFSISLMKHKNYDFYNLVKELKIHENLLLTAPNSSR